MGFLDWVNPYTAIYDKKKSFLENCEAVGKYRQDMRRERRKLKDLRSIRDENSKANP